MLFTGIDWSDQALDFHLRTADGQVLAFRAGFSG